VILKDYVSLRAGKASFFFPPPFEKEDRGGFSSLNLATDNDLNIDRFDVQIRNDDSACSSAIAAESW